MPGIPSLNDTQANKLKAMPEFMVFVFDIIDHAGLMDAHHEEQHAVRHEGRRSLGLEILGWLSAESGAPFDVIVKAYEAAKINPKEAKRDQSRYRELDD